jgi:ribosomal protein S12 methylthiotransferase
MNRSKNNIRIVTLGCSKNTVDSELLMGQLAAGGKKVLSGEEGDSALVVVINTCGFILDAKKESIGKILGYVDQKQKGNVKKVYVMGCLAERYRTDLIREIPEIDGIFGVNELPEILSSLGVNLRKELAGERLLTTPSHYAYLKISEGCDRHCSFCAIPLIRGRHMSKPMENIIREAETLAADGVRELILIAQDLTCYGVDNYHKRKLPELVEKLASIKSLEWIRLHYAYPAGFPVKLLKVLNSHPNVCNYIDIPIQHINDRVLRSMKRGITGRQTRKLLDSIRTLLPGVAIRTTLITGYPGETDNEFIELVDFIKQFKFDRLGVFPYSHEEGTPAYRLKDDIPEKIKKQRVGELMQVQEEISFELNQNKLGKVYKVLIDEEEGDYYVGRTEFDSPEVDQEVLIGKKGNSLTTGRFYPVMITGAESFDLYGTFT